MKDPPRPYGVFLPDAGGYGTFGGADFKQLRDTHWRIECQHRTIKQVCNIERFQLRTRTPILNHIVAARCGYLHRQQLRFTDLIGNAYR